MAETDVPTKLIPHGLKVPAGWKQAHVKPGCFYWTRKGSSSYKENCVVCNHQFNGINVARLSKTIRVGEREGYFVCGGNCWGTYLAMDNWEQCLCGICISWCHYIEKLREPDHQRSPFDGPPDEADAKASQDSASAAQMCIENQRGESGRASHGDPRTLKEIMQQNTRLLEQHETLKEQQKILQRMLAEQQQMLVHQQEGLKYLHENVVSLLAYCKTIVTKINTIPGVHSATNTSMTADSATNTKTDDTILLPNGGWIATC